MAVTAPGSPYVESSDLVANYPGVSESLAERVDLVGVLPFANSTARGTALPSPTDGQYSYLQDTNATEYYNGSAWVAAGVAPGLVHINTTALSGSSVSINNCFTSIYRNYLIVWRVTLSGANNFQARLRVGGVDASTNYTFYQFTGSGGGTSSGNNVGQTTFQMDAVSGVGPKAGTLNLFDPQVAANTTGMLATSFNMSTLGTGIQGGSHTTTASYDGITFRASAGTMTAGQVNIYGLKD